MIRLWSSGLASSRARLSLALPLLPFPLAHLLTKVSPTSTSILPPMAEVRRALIFSTKPPLPLQPLPAPTPLALPLPLLETCVNAQFPMSNVPTNAHIHAPAKIGSNAGAIIQLFSSLTSLGGDACEIVSCFAVTDQQYNWIRDGMAYINIHTAANPGGELRGQISDMTVPAPSSRALVELELVDAKQAQDHNGCLLSRGRNYPLREEMGGFKSSCVTKRIAMHE
mmetsp:Transcript_9481/g.23803  ORF Transcript_9481/g.23803 Transcript_9481/m.23803 type:complete len:225 (+) Transcript_9481:273-947(+)